MRFRPHVSEEAPTLLGLLEKPNLNHWTIYIGVATTIYKSGFTIR
jgi:hypothetical protein